MRRWLQRTLGWALQLLAVGYLLRWVLMQLRRVLLLPTTDTTPRIGPDAVAPGMRRVIISDTHLGSGDRLDDFDADALLSAFLLSQQRTSEPTELILAGDTFEFLQVRVPGLGDYVWSGEAAERRLSIILSAHPEPIAALRTFVAHTHNQLTILIGNHDFELHYAAAKRLLYSALGLSEGDRRLRFGISYEGGGIYLEHGNQFDDWNRFVSFEGISEPFEVVRGTRVVKDVINPLEDDPLDVAPLIDNVKPTSAFYWYLLSLPRLRRPEVRRFVVRGLLLMFRSVALPRTYRRRPVLEVREELLGAPGETLQRELALQAVYELDPQLRAAAAANHGGVEPEVRLRPRRGLPLLQAITRWRGRTPEGPEYLLEDVEREAGRQLRREIREFKGAVLQAMVRIANDPAHSANTLFVCGHTHQAQMVPLNDRQTYINTGTWTTIVRDIVSRAVEEQRFPFLEITYPDDPERPQANLRVWYGDEQPTNPWSSPEDGDEDGS